MVYYRKVRNVNGEEITIIGNKISTFKKLKKYLLTPNYNSINAFGVSDVDNDRLTKLLCWCSVVKMLLY